MAEKEWPLNKSAAQDVQFAQELNNSDLTSTETESSDYLLNANFASLEVYDDKLFIRYNNEENGILMTSSGIPVTDDGISQLNKAVPDLKSIFSNNDEPNPDLIAELSSYLKKYVYIDDDRLYAILSLFIILSYSARLFNRIPYLHIRGEHGSGKTNLITVLKTLVFNPKGFDDMTPASIFRLIEKNTPTLFIDEADSLKSVSSQNKQIFQILNSGYQKAGKVARVQDGEIIEFSTYCLKVIAGIQDIHPTTEDRCITFSMKKVDVRSSKLISVFTNKTGEQNTLIENTLRGITYKHNELIPILSEPGLLNISENIYGREHDKWFPLLALAKILSNDKNDYFQQVQEYALEVILQKESEIEYSPENFCRSIINDFLSTPRAKSLIEDDKNYNYFRCTEIQTIVQKQDPYNYYRNKADVTKVLKSIGILVDRRRIDRTGPTSLYKIPKNY